MLKAKIQRIVATENGIAYQLTVLDGNSGWSDIVNVSEKILMEMNEGNQ